jgi:predicted branched-subunit amino acid permease
MRTAHDTRERHEVCQTVDTMPFTVTLVRLGLLFGVLALLGSSWAAVVSAALVTFAVATALVGADDR